MTARARWVELAFALLIVALVFHGVVGRTYFLRDDFMWLYDARRQLEAPLEFLTWRPNDYFRPVSNLFFGLEYGAFGLEPEGYAVDRLLLHAWNVFWIAQVGRLLFDSRAAGLAAAAAFAVLPRPSAALLWISAFVTTLAVAFVLPALYCHLRRLRGGGRGWSVASLVLAALALGTKESGAVVLPFLLLADLRVGGLAALRARATWLRYAPFAVLGLAYAWAQSGLLTGGAGAGSTSLAQLAGGLGEGALVQLPHVLLPEVRPAPPAAWVGAALAAAALGLGALLGGRRGARDVATSLALYLAALLPFFAFLARGEPVLAARYTYVPALGLALGFGALVAHGGARLAASSGARAGPLPRIVLGAGLAALLVLGAWYASGARANARDSVRYTRQAPASRLLVETARERLAPLLAEQRRTGGGAVLLAGAPVENVRHLRCLLALFCDVPFEAVSEAPLDLRDEGAQAALRILGPDWLLEQARSERLLVWERGRGLAPYSAPETRGPGQARGAGDHLELLRTVTRSWRSPGSSDLQPRLQVVAP